eukprot:2663660-Rhodomonas_salina.2
MLVSVIFAGRGRVNWRLSGACRAPKKARAAHLLDDASMIALLPPDADRAHAALALVHPLHRALPRVRRLEGLEMLPVAPPEVPDAPIPIG